MSETKTLFESEKGYIRGFLMDNGYYFISDYKVNDTFKNEDGISDEFLSKLPEKCCFIAYPKKDGVTTKDKEVLIRYYEMKGFKCTNKVTGTMKRG